MHIAARLGNVDIVVLLLQHGASVDATTKDLYTALHITAKENQEEVNEVLKVSHGMRALMTHVVLEYIYDQLRQKMDSEILL